MSEQIALGRPQSERFWNIIWHELKPFPGRGRFALRMAIACTATVLVSNTFRLPLQDVLPFLVLFASKEEKVTTAITCVLALTAVTIAIGASLVIFKLTAGRPEFRIPGMAVEIFIGMYLFRTLAVGPVGFILAFIVSVSQSIVDLFPTPEEAVHEYLWVWAAVALAVCIAWISNFLLFAVPPTEVLQQQLKSNWRTIASASTELIHGSPAAAKRLLDVPVEQGP
ncbi:MAG: hypothetical protein JO331_12230, partial [Verrucomicrobia bacterium]|nr:hypothetical protein [Verrucomicrobiota bacterium]